MVSNEMGQQMKVLITGGLGLIGHNVAARLQRRKDTVSLVVKLDHVL